MSRRRYSVGGRRLSAADIAEQAGVHPRTIHYRLARGVTGKDLLLPAVPHKRAGGQVKPGETFGRDKIDLPDLSAWEQLLHAAGLAGLTRAALLYAIPPRALLAVVSGHYDRVDCLRELLAAMTPDEATNARHRLTALSSAIATTGRI